MSEDEIYKFIVCTNSYAGNFEREMISYASGIAIHCGEEEATQFEAEVGLDPDELFDGYVMYCGEHDDMANMTSAPGTNDNQAVEVCFYELPPESTLKMMADRCRIYAAKNGIKIRKILIIQEITVTTSAEVMEL